MNTDDNKTLEEKVNEMHAAFFVRQPGYKEPMVETLGRIVKVFGVLNLGVVALITMAGFFVAWDTVQEKIAPAIKGILSKGNSK